MTHVSIIIPARNAADTLAETLRSVSDQIFTNWEAIVVDDGSTDETADIVEQHANCDSRFRLVQQLGAGAGFARNKGIELARFDNLLFLDADDFILPAHLARLSDALTGDSQLDAVVCGWAHVTPAGEFVFEQRDGERGDLFRAHAQYCYSLIHTYLTRRSVVEQSGGFDPAFETCEDWDLFQRVARSGARFGRVSDVLAGYRMRAGSATSNVKNLLRDGFAVIRNGHGPDRRVKQAHPVYIDGLPAQELSMHAYGHACTCAGYLLGVGLNANFTLDPLPYPPPDEFRPIDAANAILVHAMVAAARPIAEWAAVWAGAQPELRTFLSALETRLGRRGFAQKTRLIADYLLQRSIGDGSVGTLTGATYVAADRLTNQLSGVSKFTRRVALSTLRVTPGLECAGFGLKRIRAARNPAAAENAQVRFEALFGKERDSWGYENSYETTKVRQTLDQLPDLSNGCALEIGCAEGHMTRQLAPRVKRLVSTDISTTALERAARHCEDIGNVEFRHQDFLTAPPGGPYDLIVCSEVLYYCKNHDALRQVARRLAASLRNGGYLLMTHANHVIDDPDSPGFDWGQAFGSKVIAQVFCETKGLTMLREAHAPLYQIHLLQRNNSGPRDPEIKMLTMADPLPEEIAVQARSGASWNLVILAYSRIASEGESGLNEYFDSQMQELHAQGYRTQSLETWKHARDYGVPIAGKALYVVFDEPSNALILKMQSVMASLRFTATCILTVDPVSGRLKFQTGDSGSHPLKWRQLRKLQADGIKFGVALDDNIWRSEHSLMDLRHLIKQARIIVSSEIAESVSLLRVPSDLYWNRRLQWIAGTCGFDFVISGRPGVATRADGLLALPTIAASVACSPADLLVRLSVRPVDGIA